MLSLSGICTMELVKDIRHSAGGESRREDAWQRMRGNECDDIAYEKNEKQDERNRNRKKDKKCCSLTACDDGKRQRWEMLTTSRTANRQRWW